MRIRFAKHVPFWKNIPLLTATGLIVTICWCSLCLQLFPQRCGFHDFTSVACPACGGTRALQRILKGEILGGLALNPLVITSVALALVFVVEVLVTRMLGLPQLNVSLSSRELSVMVRVALILFLINWGYLIMVGV